MMLRLPALDLVHARLHWTRGAVCALTACLAACSAPTPTRLHTLMPAEPKSATTFDARQRIVVSLAPVGLPQQVDQPEWLVREPDDTLRLLEQDRWAAPLRAELHDALMDGLVRRYGVIDAQQAVAGSPGKGSSPWRVVVEVTRFDSLPGRAARLEAAWSVSSTSTDAGTTPGLACRSLWETPAGIGMVSLADAHRANVQRLADAIGRGLRPLAQGAAASCE